MSEKKLFPIFNIPGTTSQPKVSKKSPAKRKKPVTFDKTQMLIDAGQKLFGPTYCTECDLYYSVGEPDEEARHDKFHNNLHVLKFAGWKNERIIQWHDKDKIIQIVPGDSNVWWKKVSALLEVVNRDLGYYDIEVDSSKVQAFVYVANKIIRGCIIAEPKLIGHKLVQVNGVDKCSEEAYPIKCGISRIWTSSNYRKKGIATALLDSLKLHFSYCDVLNNEDIALSSPTDFGIQFGRKYFKTDNFLIYIK